MATIKSFQTIANAFTVKDIAEPVGHIEPTASVEDVLSEIEAELLSGTKTFWVIREDHRIEGYLNEFDYQVDETKFHADSTAREMAHPISLDLVLPAATPLLEALPLFQQHWFFFLLEKNEINQVITFYGIDEPPVRLCLFSLITELETILTRILRDGPVETDKLLSHLPQNRRKTAENLLQKLNPGTRSPKDVLQYTSFTDKVEMLRADPDLQKHLALHFSPDFDYFLKDLGKIRNQVAHGESILEIFVTGHSPHVEARRFSEFLTDLTRLTSNLSDISEKLELTVEILDD